MIGSSTGRIQQTARNRFPLTWLPLAIYALVAIAITWPLLTQIRSGAIGAAYGDEFERVRLIWWTRDALQHGLNPFYQGLLGYPTGFFNAPQWTEPLAYLPAALISFLTGPVVAYNLWTLIELIGSGWAAFFLCRAILSDPAEARLPLIKWGAALIGGLIFMIYPAMQGQLSGGHSGVLTLYAFPLFALALWRILYSRAGIWTAIGGAVALVITALGNTDQMVFTLFPLTLFFLVYEAVFIRVRFWHWRIIGLLTVLFGLGGVVLIPFFAPLAIQLLTSTKTADLTLGGWITYSADPLGYFALSPFTPWGARLAPGFSRIVLGTNSVEGTAYLGAFTLILCVIALFGARRRAGESTPPITLWWWVALGSAIFALGPFLKWHDQPVVYTLGTTTSYVTLPWAFFQQLPILNVSRTPGRFNLTTGLAIAVIASVGVQLLLTRLRWRWLRIGILIILIGGIVLDNQLFFPQPVTDVSTPAYLQMLAGRSDVRAVFDLPWDDLLAAKEALLFQTVHQKPLIAGYVIRQTPVDPAKLTLLQDAILNQLQPGNPADSASNVPILLHQIGADLVIAHLTYLSDPAAIVTQITSTLGAPIYQDQRIAVFNVTAGSAVLDPNRLIQSAPHTDPTPGSGSTIDMYVPDKAPSCRIAQITITQNHPATVSIDGVAVSILDPQSTSSRLITLTPGFHALHTDQPITAAPIDLAANDPQTADGYKKLIALGQGLSLRCARVAASASQTVQIDLAWHADQPLPGDDHLFVHLIGADGKIAAQDDRVPGNGQFSTTQWQVDQTWSESIVLPNIPNGTYQVEVGWYAYPSLQRIPVLDNTPGAANGLISLGSVTVP